MPDLSLSISVVIYNTNLGEVSTLLERLLTIHFPLKIYVIDNSKLPIDNYNVIDPRIIYTHNNGNNFGYGRAHNIAMRKSLQDGTDYHIVLNPDISIEHQTIQILVAYMEHNKDIGLLMPKILYPDGNLQYLCKMLPTPFDLIVRRFIPKFLQVYLKKNLNAYELKHKDYNRIMDVPNLSGCFMMMRCEILKTTGLFDERFFMYLEDTDLCRRIGEVSRTVYYPDAIVYHGYAKESYKNFRLLKYHILSAIKYFNKWGWLFDQKRREINNKLK